MSNANEFAVMVEEIVRWFAEMRESSGMPVEAVIGATVALAVQSVCRPLGRGCLFLAKTAGHCASRLSSLALVRFRADREGDVFGRLAGVIRANPGSGLWDSKERLLVKGDLEIRIVEPMPRLDGEATVDLDDHRVHSVKANGVDVLRVLSDRERTKFDKLVKSEISAIRASENEAARRAAANLLDRVLGNGNGNSAKV